MSQRWLDLLTGEGYRPRVQANERDPGRMRLLFESAGEAHYLYLHDEDPGFFRLSLRFRLGDRPAPDFALLAAANEQNREAKATKVTVDLEGRSACFDIEGFVEAPPPAALLERMLGQCAFAADRFFARLDGSAGPAPLAC
jgi:hypothetical protein